MNTTEKCPHCEPHHGSPNRSAWGVRLGPALAANAVAPWLDPLALERDSDGQPVYLYVAPTDGAHVAQEDADWLFALLRDRGRVDAIVEAARACVVQIKQLVDDAANNQWLRDERRALIAAVDALDGAP